MRIYEKWRTFLLLFECKLLSDKTVNVKKENSLANKSVVYKGSGRINIGRGTSFGSKKCQGFFSLETYIEARNSESIIRIGNNCFFNNGFNAIAEGNSGGV